MVVCPSALPEERGHGEPRGEVRREQPHDVKRDDRDETGDDPGGHQERHRRDRHHLECVDLLGDAHSTELGGEPTAHRRGQRDASDQRRDLAGVEVRRYEARERRGPELVQRGIPLKSYLRAREKRHRRDHANGATDDGESARTECHLREETQDLLLVAADRTRRPGDRLDVERELVAEGIQGLHRLVVQRLYRRTYVGHDINLSWVGRAASRLRSSRSLSLIHISEPTRRTPISYAV